jgi:glucosamine-6-phosphate isomerase
MINFSADLMQILRFKNYEELSDYMADFIANSIKNKPNLVLCMASGSTPALTCDLLVQKLKDGQVDHSKFTFLGLDEWVGLPPTNTGSCHYFFYKKIFEPLQLSSSQYFLFNALSDDLKNECIKMDKLIADKGGIDIMIVGIGMNGHIGFNEPGTSFAALSHVAELEEVTKSVGQKYFDGPVALGEGITIGLGHLMNTKKVFLMANGSKKAEVIKKTIERAVTENFPASIMQKHSNGFILIDNEAASLLSNSY